MFVPAATVAQTVRPGNFVMSVIKGSVPIPQTGHYLLDQRGHSVGRHANNPLITACRLPFYIKTWKLATEVSPADDSIQICRREIIVQRQEGKRPGELRVPTPS